MPGIEESAPVARGRSAWRRPRIWIFLTLLALPVVFFVYGWVTFPSDHTPEGAYLRIVKSVNQGKPADFFAYTEEAAQHACFTIGEYRRQSLELAKPHFPPEKFAELEAEYGAMAQAEAGPGVFALMVEREGWLTQLRNDVSGIAGVVLQGPRATIETAKGTRYSMRRRPNGIWGLTAFTPALVEEAEHAARDLEIIEKAAADFARVRKHGGVSPEGTKSSEPGLH